MYDGTTTYESLTGDINFDGVVDTTDLTTISLALIGDQKFAPLQDELADVDGDGAVTLADLARLRQYLSKKIDSLTDDKDADTVVQEKEVKYSAAISVRVTDNKLDEYPQHSIIEDRAGFEALYNEKQSLEIEKTGFYSGGIFPILNDKYTDEWFETHKLYVAYPGKGGPTGYRYKVESVTNKAVTIHWDQLGESQSRTENKADWIIFIEVSKDADVTDATEIKFNTVF
ncbi:MAG: dockerin type I repeat-containing protein [Oscillospiraceae bacterium]|nr:dockerin type I repeat-containing protein [Oscillospiraceae bacterium]